ncbi:MAG: hypothetical protein ACJ73S_08115 [Mycobacteriales bacterium]
MDSFAERIAAGLSVPAEPPAGLVEDILHGVRRGRLLRRTGTALAAVLLLAAAGLGIALAGPGRPDGVRAGALAAFTGAGRGERYPTPAGATVLALTPSGAALAVSGGTRRTLWLLRPDGNWTVLDHGHSRLADWATDGTVVAWTWTATDERGWKCLDRPGGTPVTLTLDPTGYQRMFVDQGRLVYGYGDIHLLTGCRDDQVVSPADWDGSVVGLRWPVAYLSTDQGVSAKDLRDGTVTPLAGGVPIPAGGTVAAADEQGALWVTSPEVRGKTWQRWSFGGQPAGGRPTTLATIPWSNGERRASAGRTLLAVFVTRRPHESPMHLAYDEDPATSVVYEPATGRHRRVDGAVLVAGDLLLHREGNGYRLYHLPG